MVTRRKAKRAEVVGPTASSGSGPPSVCDMQRWLDGCMHACLEVCWCTHVEPPAPHQPPQGVPLEAQALLRGLLRADPAQRLGAADVLAHSWVAPMVKQQPDMDPDSPEALARGGSPTSCASTSSGVSERCQGLRNWWAPPVSWPPQQRAARVKQGPVLPACMQPGAQLQFDIRAYASALPMPKS